MSKTVQPIDGLRIVVTGAARGIGAEAARQLSARGARLALAGLEPERLGSLAHDLGPDTLAVETDVRDPAQLERAMAAAADRFGGIDVVVANAGVAFGGGFEQLSSEEIDTTVNVNLGGAMRTARAALPYLRESRGQLVFVASLAAAVQMPLLSVYSATKAGVHALGNTLRMELRRRGIAVTVAYFGFIDTDMGRFAMDRRATHHLINAAPGPLSRLIPVEKAAAALVAGVEQRSRRVIAPRSILPAILVPGIMQALIERATRNQIDEVMLIADSEFAEVDSRPTTPGVPAR